jgi:hypothetical protein
MEANRLESLLNSLLGGKNLLCSVSSVKMRGGCWY